MRKSVQETVSSAKKLKIEKVAKHDSDDDDDDEEVVVKGKRKISCLESDSDSDYEDDNDENESDNSQDDTKFPRKQSNGAKKKVEAEPKKRKITSIEERLKSSNNDAQSFMDVDEDSNTPDIGDGLIVHKHRKVEYLKPDKICDAQKRRPDDPKYDPTTLFLPAKFLDEQTPVRIAFCKQ